MNKIIISVILISFTSFAYSQSTIEPGTWKPQKAVDEFGVPCSNKIIKDFSIEFKSNNKYVRKAFNSNGNDPIVTDGNYKIVNDTLIIDFSIGAYIAENKIQIIKIEKDLLVLDYNLCAKRDSVATARLELVK